MADTRPWLAHYDPRRSAHTRAIPGPHAPRLSVGVRARSSRPPSAAVQGAPSDVVVEGYSLTEAQMAVIANPVRGQKKIGSVGMPLPDVDLRVVDADDGTTPVSLGDVGEIVLSAPQLMLGYWQRPPKRPDAPSGNVVEPTATEGPVSR